MADVQFTNTGLWSVIFTALLGAVTFFIVRTLKQTDKNIEKLQLNDEKILEGLNELSDDFIKLKTEHGMAWETHRECMKMLNQLEELNREMEDKKSNKKSKV
jgi:hypothetical protein